MAIKNYRLKIIDWVQALFIYNSLFIILLSCFSCSYNKITPPPQGTIAKDSMQLIITDLTLLEATLNNVVLDDTVKKINVLSKYHISSQRFDSSFAYYSRNPQILKELYTKVLENLNGK